MLLNNFLLFFNRLNIKTKLTSKSFSFQLGKETKLRLMTENVSFVFRMVPEFSARKVNKLCFSFTLHLQP